MGKTAVISIKLHYPFYMYLLSGSSVEMAMKTDLGPSVHNFIFVLKIIQYDN
jgi:hypothetical protein